MGQFFSSTPSDTKHKDLASSFNNFLQNYTMETQILSQETISSIQSELMNGNVQKANSKINKALKELENAPIDIAVTGESGTGKSTFINAFLGISQDDEKAAKTGVVEITKERTPYKHPKFPSVTIWDLPGIGTTAFQPHTYLKEMKFDKYDFFLIISATRFKDTEAHLCKVIKEMKKNFYFVRTKVDSDLYNKQKANPRTFNKENTLQEIIEYCVKNLEKNGLTNYKFFLVSSFEVSEYDFPKLEKTLLKDLPAQKRHIFIHCLSTTTEAAIDWKKDSLKQKVWLEAIKAGLLSTLPLVGVISDNDTEKLKKTLSLYRSYFGLDDPSLEKMAEDMNISVEKLKGKIQSPHLLSVEKNTSLGEKLLRFVEVFCSVNGGLLATGLYLRKTYYLQMYFLDTVASDAKILLKREDVS